MSIGAEQDPPLTVLEDEQHKESQFLRCVLPTPPYHINTQTHTYMHTYTHTTPHNQHSQSQLQRIKENLETWRIWRTGVSLKTYGIFNAR